MRCGGHCGGVPDGFARVRIDGEFYEIEEAPALDKKYKHDLEVVVDRIAVREGIETRLADSFEQAINTVRRWRREEAFRIGFQALNGAASAEACGAAYADIAAGVGQWQSRLLALPTSQLPRP